MVDEVSSVSQQTAAEATNVSAASEEQASSLSEASNNIQQLSQLADRLHDNVADFDVGGQSLGSSAAHGVAEQSLRTETSHHSESDAPTASEGANNEHSKPAKDPRESNVDTIEPWTDITAPDTNGDSEDEKTDRMEPEQ